MAMENAGKELYWSSLSAGEVLLHLRQLAADGKPACSRFLDVHQWQALRGTPGLTLDGGHEQAQFRCAALQPSTPALRHLRIELSALPALIRTPHQLRTWLARHGLAEEDTGDIAIGDYAALVLCAGAPFEACGIAATQQAAWQPPQVKAQRVTAAGARVDAVVSALFHVSRGEAQTALDYGFIFRNFSPVAKHSQSIGAGDQLVYRTKGRAEVIALEPNVRSGRLWVEYRLYPC